MDIHEMAEIAARERLYIEPDDPEFLAERERTDAALGVVRDPRAQVRTGDPWRYTGDEE